MSVGEQTPTKLRLYYTVFNRTTWNCHWYALAYPQIYAHQPGLLSRSQTS